MTERSLEDRLDEIESRTAISALVAGYCQGVDQKDSDLFLSLWHDDGEYLIPGGRGNFYGLDGIRESLVVIGEAWARTWHWTTNHTVSFDGCDRAIGRSDVFAICERHVDANVCLVAATYDDEYERRNGAWRIGRRTVTRWFVSTPQDIPLPPPS
ncbi:MAG: nuclear transport factor 2 family protein [Actinobacteria bacterium]|uniref:Unannotated protein n=1 Tax=freshwater metagenome TaxID=449393 RepID=A0A6J7KDH9_9ZZZZ|nr:nuclear transport factor 2 family protein [Actinomycetota bacterium]